ncbi:MAG: shikimate dehydrogenase [Bacteroidetes bacterium]|nr:shikimate dehydrogenase [Bacteroidota bacterium]MBU1115859.1 shikimate dehydrogenase [Bacteroidota bacterium]MBU1797973.1 shikimate dehydrogenase [Bacteroidota bacterium]
MRSLNEINHNTKIIGVIGHPIKHSLSPMMHNYAFNKLDLDFVYLPFDIAAANLKDALRGMVALGIEGFNVTIPHKERIVDFLDELSDSAKIVNAVNTVVNENGKLHGYNTDVDGIIKTLEDYKEDLHGCKVSVIGAGGAARSVIYTLINSFNVEKINIINRTVGKAESLKDYFTSKMLFEKIKTYELAPPDVIEILSKSKLIVNASSIGMSPEEDDSPTTIPESFNDKQIVFDLVYNPRKTKFLSIAESQGATILNGLKMFVEQGAKAFELWTNEKMPTDRISEILNKEPEL